MSRGRKAPPPPPAMPPADELRRAALLLLDVEALRIWAATYVPDELNTIGLADDELVLVSMHEARMMDLTMPDDIRLASLLWLANRGDPTATEAARQLGVIGRGKG